MVCKVERHTEAREKAPRRTLAIVAKRMVTVCVSWWWRVGLLRGFGC